MRAIICSHDANEPVTRKATYEEFRAAVLAVGRFSIFEATANDRAAAMYTRLTRDPGIVADHESVSYPWTLVRLATAREVAHARHEQGHSDNPADEEYLRERGWIEKHDKQLDMVYWQNRKISRDGYHVAMALEIQRRMDAESATTGEVDHA